MNLIILTLSQETVLSSISAVALFGTAVGLASFIGQNEIQCTRYRYYYHGSSYAYIPYDTLPPQIKIHVQATAVS